MSDPGGDAERLYAAILGLVRQRGPGKTICPSEAARAVAGGDDDWRRLMPMTREVAARLADEGAIHVTRKGEVVDIRSVRGPVRLGLRTV